MPGHTTDDTQERAPNAADAPERPYLMAEVVLSRNRPTECTISPVDADDFERMTTWITAEEGSFVSVEEMG